jgi:hypothetical protein
MNCYSALSKWKENAAKYHNKQAEHHKVSQIDSKQSCIPSQQLPYTIFERKMSPASHLIQVAAFQFTCLLTLLYCRIIEVVPQQRQPDDASIISSPLILQVLSIMLQPALPIDDIQ